MKIKTGVFCCILWTGILVFCSMPVFAAQSPDAERVETENSAAEAAGVEPPDVKKLEVTAFSYEDGEEEKTSPEDEQLLRQLELSEKRADLLAGRESPGEPVKAGIAMLVILLGSCGFAFILWLGCRLRYRDKGKGKRKRQK